MGVEAYFFAYDAAWFGARSPRPLTIERLIEEGIVSREGLVSADYAEHIIAIESYGLGDNKKWGNNAAAETVYERVREYLPEEARERHDLLFYLLFWGAGWPPLMTLPAGVEQRVYDEETDCIFYTPSTIAYIAEQALDYAALEAAFAQATRGWPEPDCTRRDLRNLDDVETFIWFVEEWLRIMRRVIEIGAGVSWALMIYVSW